MHTALRLFLVTLFLTVLCGIAPAQAQQVRISGLQDITIREWGLGDPSINRYFDVCIYRQDSRTDSRRYGLMVTGDGPGFFLRSGMYTLRYSAFINDGGVGNPGGGRSYRLLSGVPVFIDLNHARIAKDKPENSSDCNGNSYPTARITFNTSAADLDKVPDGTYRGVINLTLMAL
jgi:hypothetical protein